MRERQNPSLMVGLWVVFGGAIAVLVTTPPVPGNILGDVMSALSAHLQMPLSADETDAGPFAPSADAMADVDETLAAAKAEGKLALIVLGANWCHDSRGLIDHFDTPEMQKILQEKYKVRLVDVGFLERGSDITRRFGQPVYYGTPTVFVIDPATGAVVNRKGMYQWRAAASIPLSETVAYFSQLTPGSAAQPAPPKANLQAALDAIAAFEKQQAKRIEHAYTILGPLVALPREERPDGFYDMWEQVRVLRYKLTDDLTTLRAIARRSAAYSDTEIELKLPTYPPFDWE
ncbi:thioredoxin family protein [Kordiimonas sp.]|uniref:thioredoxin family protein n=1 Tax=Kordiimonas sp. TaxID=1970157 RepID=UPI003A8F4AF4